MSLGFPSVTDCEFLPLRQACSPYVALICEQNFTGQIVTIKSTDSYRRVDMSLRNLQISIIRVLKYALQLVVKQGRYGALYK